MWAFFTKIIAAPLVKIAAPVVVICAIGVLLYLGISGRWRFGSDGDDGGLIPVFAVQDTPDVDDGERPPSLLIGIHEGRIIFDEEDVSLYELEEILLEFQDSGDVWQLQDIFRASNAVFNDVRDLLRSKNITFVEN